MDESRISQTRGHSSDGTAIAEPATDAHGRFERGDEMEALYEQMRPDQRTAIAGEFIRMLTLAGDNQADQFRDEFRRHTQITDTSATGLLSAGQVATIDSYVRQSHPEMIAQAMQHPVTQSALEMPGAPPQVEEEEAAANEDKIMPTENVATSGAAYATSWEMMELGGEEANRLAEAPHEGAVTPGAEDDEARRAIEYEEGRPQ